MTLNFRQNKSEAQSSPWGWQGAVQERDIAANHTSGSAEAQAQRGDGIA